MKDYINPHEKLSRSKKIMLVNLIQIQNITHFFKSHIKDSSKFISNQLLNFNIFLYW